MFFVPDLECDVYINLTTRWSQNEKEKEENNAADAHNDLITEVCHCPVWYWCQTRKLVLEQMKNPFWLCSELILGLNIDKSNICLRWPNSSYTPDPNQCGNLREGGRREILRKIFWLRDTNHCEQRDWKQMKNSFCSDRLEVTADRHTVTQFPSNNLSFMV